MLSRYLPQSLPKPGVRSSLRRFGGVIIACLSLVGCNQIKSGAAKQEAAKTATKYAFQFWVQDAFVLNRPEGAVLAITGDVGAGYANPGDDLLIETPRGPVEIKLIAIERGEQSLSVVYPGNHVALIVQGIDKASVKFGSVIVMAVD